MTPAEAWKILFRRGVRVLRGTCRRAHVREPIWTFGGGTRLMLLYDHRVSRDIDLFLQASPQYLTLLSPRVNDHADDPLAYVEQASFLKLTYPEGDVDFIIAPTLTPRPFTRTTIEGQRVRAETAAEIIVKKLYYRAEQLRGRDLFDLATVLERDPTPLLENRALIAERRDAVLARLKAASRTLRREYEAVDRIGGPHPPFDAAVRGARAFFEGC